MKALARKSVAKDYASVHLPHSECRRFEDRQVTVWWWLKVRPSLATSRRAPIPPQSDG